MPHISHMWLIQYATIYPHVGNMWATCRQSIMCGTYVAKKFGVNSLKILPHIDHFQILPHIGHVWQSKSKVSNCFCHIFVIYVWRCLAYMWLKILQLICHMWLKCRISMAGRKTLPVRGFRKNKPFRFGLKNIPPHIVYFRLKFTKIIRHFFKLYE